MIGFVGKKKGLKHKGITKFKDNARICDEVSFLGEKRRSWGKQKI